MGVPCTICHHPKRQDFEAAVLSGKPVRTAAQECDIAQSAAYRHIAGRHHIAKQAAQTPAGTTITAANDSTHTLAPQEPVAETILKATRLAKAAERHMRKALRSDDMKAANGALASATKAFELFGRATGQLQTGSQVNVTVTADMRQAVDSHAQAQQLAPHDVTEQARAYLAAQLEAGDAEAIRAVLSLVRMVPGADATGDAQP